MQSYDEQSNDSHAKFMGLILVMDSEVFLCPMPVTTENDFFLSSPLLLWLLKWHNLLKSINTNLIKIQNLLLAGHPYNSNRKAISQCQDSGITLIHRACIGGTSSWPTRPFRFVFPTNVWIKTIATFIYLNESVVRSTELNLNYVVRRNKTKRIPKFNLYTKSL